MASNGRGRNPDNSAFEPQTMAGQISSKEMGSRVAFAETPSTEPTEPLQTTTDATDDTIDFGSDLNLEKISYRPTNAHNRASFGRLTTEIRNLIPDEPHSVIISAADAVLAVLYSDESSIVEKRKNVENLLSTQVNDAQMASLVAHAKSITDYRDEAETEPQDGIVAVEFEEDEPQNEPKVITETEGEAGEVGNGDEPSKSEKDLTSVSDGVVIQSETTSESTFSINDVTKDVLFSRFQKLEPEKEHQEILDTCKSISRLLTDPAVDETALEAGILEILDYKHLEFAKFCVSNRWRIVYGLRLLQNREKTIEDIKTHHPSLLSELGISTKRKREESEEDSEEVSKKAKDTQKRAPEIVDLDALVFDQGPQLMASAKIVLPKGSYQQNKKLYDTITVPAPAPPPTLEESGETLVSVSEMPEWARAAFPAGETATLNRIQSKVYPTAFQSDRNMLLCAPTGAGKTNVAMLAMLRVLHNHRNAETGKFDLRAFKAVYVAPLKALVSEQMREFERRLSAQYGVVVNELTGDSSLSQREIADTQVLVTTPEKWDVVTRKASDDSYTKLVRLMIVDEVHLLHDDRGPVLESIIVRAKRQPDTRIVALSATLPNYEDVARFIDADLTHGLFYFDSSFRPCPLEQQFLGVKDKKAILKVAAMNEACYDKVAESRANKHQVIVFVHSRKDTVKTAKWLAAKFAENGIEVSPGTGTQEVLRQEAENRANRNLAEILPSGFGVHHAGLNKDDRSVVEDLFAQGHVQVLVSTATLAWGVNLPAHTVIIKGTDTYNPEKGSWVQLSPQDILQMLGRAGRPRYDKSGEGVIITAHEELQYYLAILNQQLPIESQFMSRLADNLNAEVVLGSVRTRDDAVAWLAQTYLYIRMLKSPQLYQVGANYAGDDPLYWKRADLCHSALTILEKNHLVVYDPVSGKVSTTELGKIAAHFYIGYESIALYNSSLKPWMGDIDILRVFALSGEFKYVPVRQEEKLEVAKLAEKCPIPIKEAPSDPRAKINVLLQAYISRLSLDGFALTADMIYITQSAGRLLRAIHEICLKKKWAQLAHATLDLCKCVERRMWNTHSPFRQFGAFASREIVRATEASHLPFTSYFQLSAAELAEAINFKGSSHTAHQLLQQFPRVSMECQAQPISPSLVRVSVEITPEWQWNKKVHSSTEPFLLLVEDCDGEHVLYEETIRITSSSVNRTLEVDFTVPVADPLAPNLFVTMTSEKWLHSQWRAPVKMFGMKLPKQPHSSTAVLDVQNVPISALKHGPFEETFGFTYLNKFQSQCFHSVWNTNDNVFIGLSKGSGKTTIAELAILNAWRQNKQRILYLQPTQELVDASHKAWARKYANLTDPPKVVAKLTGEVAADAKILAQSHLVLATPEQFDAVSRRWRQRKAVQLLDVVVADDAHLVGSGVEGVAYESVLTRLRFMSSNLGRELRFVVFSAPLIYGREFAEWLGCKKQHVFNFAPSARAQPLSEIKIQPYSEPNFAVAYAQKCAESVAASNKALVFVPSRKSGISLVAPLMAAKNWAAGVDFAQIEPLLAKVQDVQLRKLLEQGVGLYHEAMSGTDRLIVERLFKNDLIKIVIATKETCSYAPESDLVVIYGSQTAGAHQNNDYYLNDVLNMVGCSTGKVLAYLYEPKVAYYHTFLTSGMPVESNLNGRGEDVFLYEIAAQTCQTQQDCLDWLTNTYFYRRVTQNPSFYGVSDTSHVGLSEFLSELIEDSLEELQKSSLVEIEEEEDEDEEEQIAPLNGAMIASYYSVMVSTMKTLGQLTSKARMRNILEAVTSAAEFEDLPVRQGEDVVLARLAQQVPLKLAPESDFESPHVKAFLLLQAHFSRIALSPELGRDQALVARKSLKLVHAAVDTLSSEGYLNALQAMDLSQMIVQGMWHRDSPLMQIPHVSSAMLERCKKYNVETVYDIMTLEDDERDDVLRLEGAQLQQVAEFVNQYPNIDVRYELDQEPMVVDESKSVTVVLERDEDADDLSVSSARLSAPKTESWWVVIGDAETRQLYAIKKALVASESQSVSVDFSISTPGTHHLTIWCMCDSYVDADKEMELTVEVKEAN